jgi:2-polyprenyl-3-methyl-5-hydroxy-6-metoxy-1,4-benzoquinol methylase
LDKLENVWWNENANTIEQIWGLSHEAQTLIRLPYLRGAKAFFTGDGQKSVIWEVGCGTGWVCRLIADDDLHVIGTDFSQAQIDLANESAKSFGKDHFCQYVVANASTKVEGYQGILIHALLHHLSREELTEFFRVIEHQKPGTKVFIYEPTFVQARNMTGRWIALLAKTFLKLYRLSSIALIRLAGTKQETLSNEVSRLFAIAETNSWFLSPKEIPFNEDELDEFITTHFDVQRSYFVNHLDLELAQEMALNGITRPGPLFSKLVVPVATAIDRLFFALNFRSVSKDQYFYKCFELITK